MRRCVAAPSFVLLSSVLSFGQESMMSAPPKTDAGSMMAAPSMELQTERMGPTVVYTHLDAARMLDAWSGGGVRGILEHLVRS